MAGTTQIQPPSDKTKILYDAVSKEYDIGTYDEFSKKLQDPTKRKAFYDGVGKEFDLGSYDQFEQKVGIKKKDVPGAGSPSPSGSSPKPAQTEPSVGTSGSDPKQVTANFKNNNLTPKDMGDQPIGDLGAPSPEQLSHGINNKDKNLSTWQNNQSDGYVKSLVNQHQAVQKRLTDISEGGSMYDPKVSTKQLTEQEQYLRGQIQKEYDARKQKVVPELVDNLKDQLGGYNWTDIYQNETRDQSGHSDVISPDPHLKWDDKTHKLTPESTEWVAAHVDDFLNKKGDIAINAQVSGNLDNKKRTYVDATRSVVDYLNTIPVIKKQQDFTEEFTKRHPELKDALNATREVNDFFSKENVGALNAKVNIDRDKAIMTTGQKYFGKNGIAFQNKDFVSIQEKYAQLVADGKMTKEVAVKQIDAEARQNQTIKKLYDNYDTEIRKIHEKTQNDFGQYIVDGLKDAKSKYTVYKDGTVGLSGMPEDKYKNLIGRFYGGLSDIAIGMGMDSNEEWQKQANKKANTQGAFLGSLTSFVNDLAGAFSKKMFNKTQWGQKNVQYFEAQDISSPDISQSQVAASWNWKGLESLIDPNFWMSTAGATVPVIAGAAAIGLATDGAGMPEYIGWLANAGLFTAQRGLSTYSQMLNTRDAQGNLLTEADASHYMADQMKSDFLPNVLMMAVTSGTLLKAKNIVKPSIAGTFGKALLGTAEAQPFFTWQGYNDYATAQEAQGKKTDFWDYTQSKDFRDNLINGMVVGGGLSLLHAPGTYMKSVDNWIKMVHTSEGEFKNLIPQNYALGMEMSGNGNYLRDALKMHVFNIDPTTLNEEGKRNLADLKNTLLYSTNLDRNIKQGNLDPKNVNDLYQAHNLALADQHDYLSQQAADQGNKSLSDVYSDKTKDYREQAKAAAGDQAKFTYLVNEEGHPIFMSDKSFKTLEKEGTIAKWMKDGTIKDVVKSDDPEFAQRYKDFVTAKDEANVEGTDILQHGKNVIEQNKDKLGIYYAPAKENPEEFYQNISDQVHGYGRDSKGNLVKSDLPNAEQSAREQYGDDIVDTAKLLYPITEKEGGQDAITKSQGAQRESDQQTGEQEHPRTSAPRNEGEKPETDRSHRGTDSEGEKVTPQGAGTETAPLSTEYKPQIRDDYFARSDFFTPEEKEKFQTLDDAGKDKMIDDKRAELKEKSLISVIQPSELKPPNVVTPEGPKVGIAHEVKQERETKSGVKAPERGTGLSAEEGVQRGRDLINGGADPVKTMEDFEKDGLISADRISIARAHLEQLAKDTQAAIKKFGRGSKRADVAGQAESDWAKRIQPMQSEWAEAGRRQQGATDIETGSFTGFSDSFEKAVGRPLDEEEQKTAKELVDKVNELTEKQGKLEAKVKELLAKGKEPKTEEESIKERAKKVAQKIREKAKLNRPGMFMAATPASLVWDGAVELVASTIQAGGLLADAIQRGVEHIKASEWYNGLSVGRQKQAIDEFSAFHKDADKYESPEEKKIARLEKELGDLKQGIAKQKSPKSEDSERARELKEQIKDAKENLGLTPSSGDKPLTPEEEAEENERKTRKLAEKFLDKKDGEFSEEEGKAIWGHVSENYLDKGLDVPESIQNTAIDLGLTVEQVLRAMTTPKELKNVSQEMWDIQSEKRKAINSARYFVENADKSGLQKAFNKLPSVFFTVKTFGHGTVGNITHAGPNLFRPSTWGAYWPNVIKSFDLAYGSKANYEKSVFILQNKPHFNEWLKDGLAADPNKIYDEYQLMAKPEKKTQFGRGLQWMTDTGTKGFAGLNFMRYDMAEMLYNRASNTAKADPNFRKLVAELVNHATGHTDAFSNSGKVGKVLKVISFAPGLEVSRWQRMIIDPVKAAKTFSTWNSSTAGEKAAAKITAQSAGEKIALYGVLLAANAGLMAALGSRQHVNINDPTQSDWLRFKFLNKTLDVTGNMTSPYRLLYTLGKYAYKANFGKRKDVQKSPGEAEKNELARQARYKLSPIASNVADLSSGTDAMGNVLPWSKIKPPVGRHKLTWDELIGQEALPIPVQAGIEAFHSSMEAKGMSKTAINGIMNGLLLFGVEGFTGAKLQDDYTLKNKK